MKLSALVSILVKANATPQMILDAVLAWEKENPDPLQKRKDADAERQRRWRERLRISSTEWFELTSVVKARDGYACTYCGDTTEPLHCDHVVPLIQGGSNDLDNLVTACRACNGGKSGRTPEQWRPEG